MIIFDNELPDYPGFNPSIDDGEWEEKSIKINVSAEQIKDLKALDLDPKSLIEDVLVKEIYIGVGNLISSNVILPKEKCIDIENLFDFLNSKVENKDLPRYMLTNIAVGATIQEYPGFQFGIAQRKLAIVGSLYLLGNIGDCQIYVDSNMEYSNNRMSMFSEDFFNYKDAGLSIMIEGTSSPVILAKYKVKMDDPKSDGYIIKDPKLII